MTKKIFIAIWRGEGAHDFGILGRPSEKEEDVYSPSEARHIKCCPIVPTAHGK